MPAKIAQLYCTALAICDRTAILHIFCLWMIGLQTIPQKTSRLWLAIIFTYTVWLQQFLAKILLKKQAVKMYFIFPPHLTIASALTGKTGNPKIVSFHLNAACFFTKKTWNTVKNITWSELNHPSLSKQSTGCTTQDLGREHSILLSVAHMLCINQVCHGVSRCVKDESCSLSSLSESQWTVLMRYLTISTNVWRYQTHHRW